MPVISETCWGLRLPKYQRLRAWILVPSSISWLGMVRADLGVNWGISRPTRAFTGNMQSLRSSDIARRGLLRLYTTWNSFISRCNNARASNVAGFELQLCRLASQLKTSAIYPCLWRILVRVFSVPISHYFWRATPCGSNFLARLCILSASVHFLPYSIPIVGWRSLVVCWWPSATTAYVGPSALQASALSLTLSQPTPIIMDSIALRLYMLSRYEKFKAHQITSNPTLHHETIE